MTRFDVCFRCFLAILMLAVCTPPAPAQNSNQDTEQNPPPAQQNGDNPDQPAGDAPHAPETTPATAEQNGAEQPSAAPTPDEQPEPAPPVELPPPLSIDVSLFRPDSLAGWTHAATPPSGWSISQGRLTGQGPTTDLLSGYAWGDFELQFGWTAQDSAAISIRLPRVPSGPALEVALSGTKHCGQVRDGGKELSAGKEVGGDDQPHDTVIARRGSSLSVTVDGREVSRADIDATCRLGLALAADGGEVTLENMRLRAPLGEPIFNGTDLTGWWCPGNIDAWQPIDGELVLAGRGGNYLRSEKLYANFTLSFEFKIKKGGNSGVGIRTARDGWPSGDGMELQILDSGAANKDGMMAIYRNVPTLAVAHQSQQWNQAVIQAEGRMITAWINGQLVQQVNTEWEPELQHRHLTGWIGFQDHGAKIQIRHLRLTEAPDGTGLDAWYQPRPEPAAEFVLGRLMNSERLSRDDGSHGSILTTHVPDRGEHVLAQLRGPGAVVRISSDDWSGELALFFDGEQEPRIKCRARDLASQVPRLPGIGGKAPVITCLPYAQSLKIVLIDGGPATYRIDFTDLPPGASAASCDPPAAAIPESLAAAMDYRIHHHAHGTVRQKDPYLRVASERKKLAPGERIECVQIEGAGLVQWVQVHAPKEHLQTDDLWLEVGFDGQREPALLAPARYFFSGAAVAGRYGNYLLTEQGGPINRLAMPFGDGICLSLINRGSEPIGGAGLTASVQQPANEREAAEFARRLRLRGVFYPAAAEPAEHEFFHWKGRGRWVGIVCDTALPESDTTGDGEDSAEEATGAEEREPPNGAENGADSQPPEADRDAADRNDAPENQGKDATAQPDAPESADDKPAEGKPTDQELTDEKPTDDKPANEKPANEKPANDASTDEGDGEPRETDQGGKEIALSTVIESLDIDGQPAAGWQPTSIDDLLGSAAPGQDFRGALDGRQASFAWRYLLLAPVDFERELIAVAPAQTVPASRLVLFYAK